MIKLDELINNKMFICLLLIIVGYCIAKVFADSCNCSNGVRNGFSVGAQTDQCRVKGLCSGAREAQDFCWDPQVGLDVGLTDEGSFEQNCDTQEGMFKYSDLCDSNAHKFYVPLTDAGGMYHHLPYDHCLQASSDPRTIYACGLGGTKCIDCTGPFNAASPACKNKPQTNQADCERDCTAQFGTFSCKPFGIDPLNSKVKCQQNKLAKKVDPQNNIFANLDECLAQGCGYKCDPKVPRGHSCNKETNDPDGGFEDSFDCHDYCKSKWGCLLGSPRDANGCVQCIEYKPGDPGHNLAQYDSKQKCKEGHCGEIYTCDHKRGKCTCTDVIAGQGQKKPACNVTCNKEKFVKYVCPETKKFSTAGCITQPASKGDQYSWDTTLPNATEKMGEAKTLCDAFSLNGKRCNKPCSYDFDEPCSYDPISKSCTKPINTTAGTGIYSDITSCDLRDDNIQCTKKNSNAYDPLKNICPVECEGTISDDKCNPVLRITQTPNNIAVDNNLGCKSKFPQFDISREKAIKGTKHSLINKPIEGDCSPCKNNPKCNDKGLYPHTICHLDSDARGNITCVPECKSGWMPDPKNNDRCVKVRNPVCNTPGHICGINQICVESGANRSKCICKEGFVLKGKKCVKQPVDCLGDWGDCDKDCNSTYSIIRPEDNGGIKCSHGSGSIKKCAPGDGNCEDPCRGARVICINGGECFNIPHDSAAYTAECLGATGAKGDPGSPGIDAACHFRDTQPLCEAHDDCMWSSGQDGESVCTDNL